MTNPTASPKFELPFIYARQAGAYEKVNEGRVRSDAMIAVKVKDRDLTAPPGTEIDGDVFIPATGATSPWTGNAGQLAIASNGGWIYIEPKEGQWAYVADEGVLMFYDGVNWHVHSGDTFALTDGATIDWDMAAKPTAEIVLGGNRTLNTPTNFREGQAYALYVIQDGTGSRTLTWPSEVKWPGGSAPTLSTGANAIDLVTLIPRGTNLYATAALDFS